MSASLNGRRAGAVLILVVLAAAALVVRGGDSGDARAAAPPDRVHDVVFAIHGGAGTIRREDLTPEQERAYREALTTALEAGRDEIASGG